MANVMKSGGGITGVQVERAPTGYYLYRDGSSRWGVGVWYGDKLYPKMITEKEHNMGLEEKLKLWGEYEKAIEENKKKDSEKPQTEQK
jgi:hypothetical protein